MRPNKFVVLLILTVWFVFSFITNILGPDMPVIIENFQLSLTLAAFLPFSFLLAFCSGFFGGTLVPLIIGWIGDHIDLRLAMLFIVSPLGYIFTIPFWAKPLVNNKTIKFSELLARE